MEPIMSNVPKVDVVICLPGNYFSRKFLNSWSNSLVWLSENNYSYIYRFGYSPIISDLRNYLLKTSPLNDSNNETEPFMLFENKLICNKIVFIDSDMVWDVKDFEKLITTDKDFLSGAYLMTEQNNVSVSINRSFLSVSEFNQHKTLFEINHSGLGFASCNFTALENIPFPWFMSNIGIDLNIIGEDVYFCELLTNAGYKLFCDPTIKLGHEKSLVRIINDV
jgi:hypothetical protein